MRLSPYIVFILLSFVCPLFAPVKAADRVVIFTENLPPYNYRDDNGKIVGTSTLQVQQVMDKTGLDYEIKLVPWSRAIRNAETMENALVYSMGRIPKRESRFDWLVPLMSDKFYLFGNKNDKRLVNAKTIRQGDFTAACLLEDISCALLKRAGFPEKSMLKLFSTGKTLETFQIMMSGRANLAVSTLRAVYGSDLNVSDYGPAYQLSEGEELYLSTGWQTSQNIRDAVRLAYKALEKEGLFLQPYISQHFTLPEVVKD